MWQNSNHRNTMVTVLPQCKQEQCNKILHQMRVLAALTNNAKLPGSTNTQHSTPGRGLSSLKGGYHP